MQFIKENNCCNSILAVTDENDKSRVGSPSAVNGMFQQLRSKCLWNWNKEQESLRKYDSLQLHVGCACVCSVYKNILTQLIINS